MYSMFAGEADDVFELALDCLGEPKRSPTNQWVDAMSAIGCTGGGNSNIASRV